MNLEETTSSISGTRQQWEELVKQLNELKEQLTSVEGEYKSAESEYNNAQNVFNEYNLQLTRQTSKINSMTAGARFQGANS